MIIFLSQQEFYMRKVLKKGDFVLFFFFLAAAALLTAVPLLRSSQAPQYVRVTAGGSEYGVYPLDRDTTIEIEQNGHKNILVIQHGQVHMDYSDCHNQVCVDTGRIVRTGESIVCLPNRVVAEIIGSGKGGEEDEAIDAVVK